MKVMGEKVSIKMASIDWIDFRRAVRLTSANVDRLARTSTYCTRDRSVQFGFSNSVEHVFAISCCVVLLFTWGQKSARRIYSIFPLPLKLNLPLGKKGKSGAGAGD